MAFSHRGAFLLGNRLPGWTPNNPGKPGYNISTSPSPSFSCPTDHADEKQQFTLGLLSQASQPPPRSHKLHSFSRGHQCLDNHPWDSSAPPPHATRKDDDRRAPLDTRHSTSSNYTSSHTTNNNNSSDSSNGPHPAACTNHSNNMVANHSERQLTIVATPHRPRPHRPETPVFSRVVTAAATPTVSPTTTHTAASSMAMTATSPVRIPGSKTQRSEKRYHDGHKHHHGRGRQSPVQRCSGHNPNAISPSVAALLAITNIPRVRVSRNQALAGRLTAQPREECMTVDAIIQRVQRNEKEMSLTLSRSPLDVLLSSPDDGMDDSDSLSFSDDFDDNMSLVSSTPSRVNMSSRAVSDDSVSSLDDFFTSGSSTLSPMTSPGTPGTPLTNYTPSTCGSSYRRRSPRVPLRRQPEPLSSPPGSTITHHPLTCTLPPVDDLDFRVFKETAESGSEDEKKSDLRFMPLKSAFKSNLTASLRALRNAARSISNLGIASIPPDDFLTRSILTIDPRVPFTDERRPPRLEEEPSAALRRYLNPTTSARMELRSDQPNSSVPATTPRTNFTASIQMQTYKVRRSRPGAHHSNSSSSLRGIPSPSPQKSTAEPACSSPTLETGPEATLPVTLPGRQREMRENSDFIRIAVMEMAMRKRGKLSDQRPGRARWALPPRKTSNREYEVGPDGVPARWVSVSVAASS